MSNQPSNEEGKRRLAKAEAAVDTGAGDMDTGPDEPAKAEATNPAGKGGRGAEALTLIAKLLARSGVTEAFRDEMEGYKRDIADGAFEDTDYQYLVALRKRLAGKG